MNTQELVQNIKSAGFYPIPVEENSDHSVSSGLMFSGTVDNFFEAAKALGTTVMFISVSKLDEADFHYDSDDEDEIDETHEITNNTRTFDLTVALPSLANFKKHIGHEGQFLLTARTQLATLNFYLFESWWNSFGEQREKAVNRVDENREAVRGQEEAQRLKKEDDLLAKTRSLLDDPEFCRIPTQRGMKTHALEKFPELEEVDDSRLTQEIQKLSDKAKSRKRR